MSSSFKEHNDNYAGVEIAVKVVNNGYLVDVHTRSMRYHLVAKTFTEVLNQIAPYIGLLDFIKRPKLKITEDTNDKA